MNNMEFNYPEVFDINSLAQYLGCSAQTIRLMVKEHKLPTYKLGRKYFFRKVSIDEWLSAQENQYKICIRKKDMENTIKKLNDC